MRLPASARWTLRGAILAFALVTLLPIAIMLVGAFRVDGQWSLAAYGDVLVEARQWSLLGNTVLLGSLGTAGALILGLPYAFFIARTEFPLRRFFAVAHVAPILMPPLILAWAWTRTPEWFVVRDLRGMIGCAVVFALCYYPFITLLASRAFRSTDASLEEAARLAGGRRRSLVSVSLRLALPSILSGALLAFIFIISDFALPDFISTIGPKQNVYAGEIFFRSKRLGSTSEATAASVPLMLLTGAALAIVLWLRGRRSYRVVSGDFRPPERIRLGAAGAAGAFLHCAFVIGISVVAPFGALIANTRGLEAFEKAITNPGARKDIVTTLATASLAATIMVVLGFLLAYAIAHLREHGRRKRALTLESVTILPLAIPALMMGVGLIRLWNRPEPFFDTVYTTQGIVVLVYIARYLPFPVVALTAGLSRLDTSIEEAGAVAGARFFTRVRLVLLPLLRHSLIASWILAFLFSMRELDTMVLIAAGNDSLPFRVFNEIHFGRDPEIAAICLIMVFLIALPLVLYALLCPKRLDAFDA